MFDREVKLIGLDNLEKIQKSKVCIIGLGGVGGHAVEALIRAGIENIIIIDYDIVNISNKNRQIIATDRTIGKKKTIVMKDRILEINKNVNITIIDEKINSDNINLIFDNEFDYFIDACDTVSVKKEIIKKCLAKKIKFITCMGTGNKLDPSKLKICDIRETNYDPLARLMRKFIRDQKITEKIMVVSSTEIPKKVEGSVSSISFVPSIAGIMCASYIIKSIISGGGSDV